MHPDDPIHVPEVFLESQGDLLATYLPAIFIALVCVSSGSALIRWRKRRRREPKLAPVAVVVGWSMLCGLSFILAAALAVNAWVGYFPSVQALQRWVGIADNRVTAEPGGQQTAQSGNRLTTSTEGHAMSISIPANNRSFTASAGWVYLPPDYDAKGSTTRYPTIYALHGAPGRAVDWFSGGNIEHQLNTLIAQKFIPPVIFVAPATSEGIARTEPLNQPGGPQIEDYIVEDVVAWTEANYRTIAHPDQRVIAGMSAGGLGALIIGLHHPDVFSGIVSILPYATPYTSAITADPAATSRNSPLQVIEGRQVVPGQNIFLGQGDLEPVAEAIDIRDALRKQRQVTTLRVLPGLGHNWTAARTIMPYGLVWVSGQLGWGTQK